MGEQTEALVRRLRSEGDALHARLAALTPKQWTAPVYTEGTVWTARDLLAHLITAERGHQQLITSVARGGEGAPKDLDVNRYNNSQVARLANRSAADLLADLLAVRADTVSLVSGLSDDDLVRRGRHPALGEEAALADFVKVITTHGKLHLRDLSRALGA